MLWQARAYVQNRRVDVSNMNWEHPEFIDWFQAAESFHLLCERIFDKVQAQDEGALEDWLKAAFEAGRATKNEQ